MPGLDRTGPMGHGRMTGRKMGRCTNFGKALKDQDEELKNQPDENIPENMQGRGMGRGPGRGRGRGGRGFGQGQQNRFRGGN